MGNAEKEICKTALVAGTDTALGLPVATMADGLTKYLRSRAKKRLEAIYQKLLDGTANQEELYRLVRNGIDEQDFAALLELAIQDEEADKVEAYAALALGLARSQVERAERVYLIKSLRSLTIGQLELLAEMAKASRSKVKKPLAGNPDSLMEELLRDPGPLLQVDTQNLLRWGYLDSKKRRLDWPTPLADKLLSILDEGGFPLAPT